MDQDVAAGLFDWLNSLQSGEVVTTPCSLSNGRVIWRVLQQIDRLSFPGQLPEDDQSESWIHRWNNLKHIYDALTIFLQEECGQKLPLAGGRPDLKSIAQSASLQDTILLLKLVVVAAINCGDRIHYLEQMQTLAISTQDVLMTTAQESEEHDFVEPSCEKPLKLDPLEDSSSTGPAIQSDLASEERLGRVIADSQRMARDKRDLEIQLDDVHKRFTKLQTEQETTLEELKNTNERLTSVLAGTSNETSKLATDARHESVIAALEERIASSELQTFELSKANEVLKIKSERMQKLQDDYDEIKIEREKLARKTNAVDKYQQKLESMQDIEKENTAFRTQINELQNQAKLAERNKTSSTDLLREVVEYRKLLPSIEQERHELNEMKKRLEFDYHTLEARYKDALEQNLKQQRVTEELQSRLRDYEDGQTPATPQANAVVGPAMSDSDFAQNELELPREGLSSSIGGDDQISEEELQGIISDMRSRARSVTASETFVNSQAEDKLLVALRRSSERNKQLQGHLRKQSNLIKALRLDSSVKGKQLVGFQKTPSSPHDNVPMLCSTSTAIESKMQELLALNENLRRELRLMSSAWHEQSSISVSRGIVTPKGRTIAEPQSFLGKQRRNVEDMMLGNVIS